MSKFYELLKAKANEYKRKHETVFIEDFYYGNQVFGHMNISYSELYSVVRVFIKNIERQITNDKIRKKKKYVIVDNSFNSVAVIIALLELKFIPVLIDSKTIKDLGEAHLPIICNEEFFQKYPNVRRDIKAIEANSTLPKDVNDKCGIVICSSGSKTGIPHFNYLSEEELINNENTYGDDDSKFYSYISCANISGILTNLVNPLVHNAKVFLAPYFDFNDLFFKRKQINQDMAYETRKFFFSARNPLLHKYLFQERGKMDEILFSDNEMIVHTYFQSEDSLYSELVKNIDNHEERNILISLALKLPPFVKSIRKAIEDMTKKLEYSADSLMLPRDILNKLSSVDVLDLSGIKHIYMAGGMNSLATIAEIRSKIPSIRPGVFENLYGSTEGYGVICKCNEKDFKECYINLTNYDDGIIIYTFDKKNFYQIKDGITKKISYKFNDYEFLPYLNVSAKREKNVLVDEKTLDISLLKNGKPPLLTGDMGIYIGNKLYVLGRKEDFVKIGNKRYFLSTFEADLSAGLDVDIYCTLNDQKIQIYVHDKDYDFEKLMLIYQTILEQTRKNPNILFEVPVIISNKVFPISGISGKISKKKLSAFLKYKSAQAERIRKFPNSIKTVFNKLLKSIFQSNNINYFVSDIDENNCFTISVKNGFFFPINEVLLRFLKVVDFNDELGTITLQLDNRIIFLYEQEESSMQGVNYDADAIGLVLVGGLLDLATAKLVMKPIDTTKMSLEEIIKQFRINALLLQEKAGMGDSLRRVMDSMFYKNKRRSNKT